MPDESTKHAEDEEGLAPPVVAPAAEVEGEDDGDDVLDDRDDVIKVCHLGFDGAVVGRVGVVLDVAAELVRQVELGVHARLIDDHLVPGHLHYGLADTLETQAPSALFFKTIYLEQFIVFPIFFLIEEILDFVFIFFTILN